MTNEMINRRVGKIQDEMTYLIEDLEEERSDLENRDTLTDKQSKRLDALDQLIDALNIDFEEYYL